MQKNAKVFGSKSFDNAVKFSTYQQSKSKRNYWPYGTMTTWRERKVPREIVRGADGRFYVCNERTASEMGKRYGWTRI